MSGLIVSFVIYSFFGWIFECIYCSSIEKKWNNRGFLFGPLCPIYGVGALWIIILYKIFCFTTIELFLVSFFGSMVLEYGTSFLLEKLFHARWWDYSNLPLNLHGRISLFTGIGFGLGGMFVIYMLMHRVEKIIFCFDRIVIGQKIGTRIDTIIGFRDTYMSWNGFSHGFFLIDIISMILIILITVDTTLTVSALTSLRAIIDKSKISFDERMETITGNIIDKTDKIKTLLSEKQFGFSSFEKASVQRIKIIKKIKKNNNYRKQ